MSRSNKHTWRERIFAGAVALGSLTGCGLHNNPHADAPYNQDNSEETALAPPDNDAVHDAPNFVCAVTEARTDVIAHRGASHDYPENTIIAFEKAIEQGASAIELDVHQTKDGHWVVIHDDTVDRTTNGTGKVEEMSLAEIKALEIEGGHKIPTLRETLDHIDGRAKLYIEPKAGVGDWDDSIQNGPEWADFLSEAMEGSNWRYDQLVIIGQNHSNLYAIRNTDPRIHVAPSFDQTSGVKEAAEYLGAKEINMHHLYATRQMIYELHDAGICTNVWTVDDPTAIKFYIQKGADGIVTDRPDEARRVAQTTSIPEGVQR